MGNLKNIELTAEDGKKYTFEILAYTKEGEDLYAILYPTFGDSELYIVKVEDGPNEETSSYTVVTDQELAKRIYEEYKKTNPQGIVFED